MKILEVKQTESYQQLTVQKKFLLFKWNVTYRKVKGAIFLYRGNNKYEKLGLFETISIGDLFKIDFVE